MIAMLKIVRQHELFFQTPKTPNIPKIMSRAPRAMREHITANFASFTLEMKRVLVPIVMEQAIARTPRMIVMMVAKPTHALRQPIGKHMRD